MKREGRGEISRREKGNERGDKQKREGNREGR